MGGEADDADDPVGLAESMAHFAATGVSGPPRSYNALREIQFARLAEEAVRLEAEAKRIPKGRIEAFRERARDNSKRALVLCAMRDGAIQAVEWLFVVGFVERDVVRRIYDTERENSKVTISEIGAISAEILIDLEECRRPKKRGPKGPRLDRLIDKAIILEHAKSGATIQSLCLAAQHDGRLSKTTTAKGHAQRIHRQMEKIANDPKFAT